jgi:hypothetical protein
MKKLRFNPDDYIGEKFRGCHLCGGHYSETDGDTGETNWYSGGLYPESLLIKRDGRYFCVLHYTFRYRHKDIDEELWDMPDHDREGPEKGSVDA